MKSYATVVVKKDTYKYIDLLGKKLDISKSKVIDMLVSLYKKEKNEPNIGDKIDNIVKSSKVTKSSSKGLNKIKLSDIKDPDAYIGYDTY